MKEEKLISEYGYNTPIFISDIKLDKSSASTRQAFFRMEKKGLIKRYDKGIFYFPTMTKLGPSTLSAKQVYEGKYIKRRGKQIGYYTGTAFENIAGFTTQMPNTIEIRTNKTASKRELFFGKQRVIIRKAKTEVTETNVYALQMLDYINGTRIEELKKNKEMIMLYLKKRNVPRDIIVDCVQYYSASVMRKIIELEL